MSTTTTLIASTTPTQDGVTLSFPVIGSKVKGAGYYGKADATHTVQYSVQNFIGEIVVQGSLEVEPTDDDWFDMDSLSATSATSLTNISTFIGNFVWVRATINSFSAGSINRVQFSHA